MNTFQDVLRQIVGDFELPAGLNKLGFENTSKKSVLDRDLDNGRFARKQTEGLPQLVLEFSRVKGGYTIEVNSVPPENLYKYKTDAPVQRDEVVELAASYLKSVESGQPFQ